MRFICINELLSPYNIWRLGNGVAGGWVSFRTGLVALRKLPSPNSLATACSRKVEIGGGNGYWSEIPSHHQYST